MAKLVSQLSLPENPLDAKTDRDLIREIINAYSKKDTFTLRDILKSMFTLYAWEDNKTSRNSVRQTLLEFRKSGWLREVGISHQHGNSNIYQRVLRLPIQRFAPDKEVLSRGGHIRESYPNSRQAAKVCLKIINENPYWEAFTDGKLRLMLKEHGVVTKNARTIIRSNQTSLKKKGIVL